MSTQIVSLESRIVFREIYLPSGISTTWQNYSRVGMFESNPIGAGFKINLQGQLTNTIAGRLLLGNDTVIKLEISNHNYQGSYSLFSYDEINNTSILIGTFNFVNNCIYININDLYEKDAIFTGYILANTYNYHEFFHVDNNHSDLVINNVLSDIPNLFSVINDTNTSVRQFAGDYLSTYINLNIDLNKTVEAILKSGTIITRPTIDDNELPISFVTNFNVFVKNQTDVSISGKVFYGGVLYDNYSSLSGTISSLDVLVPAITRYYGSESPSYNVMNIYLPHSVLHNLNDVSFNAPTILYLHGGSWNSNSRSVDSFEIIDNTFEDYKYLPELLSRGFIVASMEYAGLSFTYDNSGNISTIVTLGTCDDILDDISKSIMFLSTNAGQLHINNTKMCLWGYSAGGHLALLYSYKRNANAIIKLVVSEAGPTKLCDAYYSYASYYNNQNSVYYTIAHNLLDPMFAIIDSSFFDSDFLIKAECCSSYNIALGSDNFRTFLVYGSGFNLPIGGNGDGVIAFSQGEYIRDRINNSTFVRLQSPNCTHGNYSFSIDNTNNKLDEFLMWYKML